MKKDGWYIVRQKGSQIIMKHQNKYYFRAVPRFKRNEKRNSASYTKAC
jgi:predicted RNA binding protein YcfA (HicA-like mRNA interferase family)